MPSPTTQTNSRTEYGTDGTTTLWNFAFSGGYIDYTHIKVYTETPLGALTYIPVTPEMLIGPFQLEITPALPAGNTLVIQRDTPKDLPIVDFVEGGNLSEVALDTANKQAIFGIAELADIFKDPIDASAAAAAAQAAADAAADSAADAAAAAIAAEAAAAGVTSASYFSFVSTGQSVFTITGTPTKANTSVFINGVYQAKSSFSVSVNVVTTDTVIPAGYKVEIVTTAFVDAATVELLIAAGSTAFVPASPPPIGNTTPNAVYASIFSARQGADPNTIGTMFASGGALIQNLSATMTNGYQWQFAGVKKAEIDAAGNLISWQGTVYSVKATTSTPTTGFHLEGQGTGNGNLTPGLDFSASGVVGRIWGSRLTGPGGKLYLGTQDVGGTMGPAIIIDETRRTAMQNDTTVNGNLTVTGSLVAGSQSFSANSSTPVLKVTQIGTGDMLVLEDDASTDPNPVVWDASGKQIIGHTVSIDAGKLQMHSAFTQFTYAANANAYEFNFKKSRGAAAGTNGASQSGDRIANLNFWAEDSTGTGVFAPAASIRAEVAGTPAANSVPGRIRISTTPVDGTAVSTRMTFEPDGRVLLAGVAGQDVGYLGMPQVSTSVNYTLVATDAGKHILHPSADTTARTITVPANASVPFPIGTTISIVNQNAAGALTISITTDTMRLAGAGTTGNRTLTANGIATLIKVTATEWLISGVNLT